MNADEALELARQLAYDWSRVELPNQQLTYTDYITTLTGLSSIIDNADRTSAIFSAVLDQAKSLGRSSEWVQAELTFEAKAEAVGDRPTWLLAELENAGVTDAALDRYNERKTRFPEKPSLK